MGGAAFVVPDAWGRFLEDVDGANIKAAELTLKSTRKMIFDFYFSKLDADQRDAKAQAKAAKGAGSASAGDSVIVKMSIEETVIDALLNTFGNKRQVQQRLSGLIQQLKRSCRGDLFVDAFCRACGVHDPLDTVLKTQYLWAMGQCRGSFLALNTTEAKQLGPVFEGTPVLEATRAEKLLNRCGAFETAASALALELTALRPDALGPGGRLSIGSPLYRLCKGSVTAL